MYFETAMIKVYYSMETASTYYIISECRLRLEKKVFEKCELGKVGLVWSFVN